MLNHATTHSPTVVANYNNLTADLMNRNKKILIVLPIALVIIGGLICFFIPSLVWHLGSSFKTQEIIYQHKTDSNVTIEFQMQDSGTFGYNRRIVLVAKGLIFDTTVSIDTTQIDKSEWKRVNQYVNELGLKGG